MSLKITNVKTILTAPAGIGLIVVKVETSDPGLYGLGCATYTQRLTPVKAAVEDYLKPLLIGRDPTRIEDIWHLCYLNSYWRNSGVLNNAISGVDMALWDILGKRAGMPVYQMLGGKAREAAAVYRHADGRDPQEVLDNVLRLKEEGYHYIRCQIGGYGGIGREPKKPEGALPGAYYDPDVYMLTVQNMFEYVRSKVGFELNLLHDVHERLHPIEAVRFAKSLEPYRLFFLEDPLAPDQIEWFRQIRAHAAVPIAMGELYNNPVEWKQLIVEQLIDFIRVHISQIGGLTPARKLAALCEAFSVRTAWHGPGDVSPVGHAANLHLDLVCHNFGIQEFAGFNDALREVFPGCPEVRNGYLYPNDRPGFGIDIDEKLAAQYPCEPAVIQWTQARLPDGTLYPP
ncbi:MAG: enolase C-terminal domain-like protein [Anaerolineae bacterium]|nr:bifunctional D-altronate/D-mannonate dehydratase [Thermoflexales bacterium]MDW8406770.1 enolase C-terminal domain-like protein [Anaerolineae bacterium]